jgi:hypothetical protein
MGIASIMANHAVLLEGRLTSADLLGASDPGEIVIGASMTALTFIFTRAGACAWSRCCGGGD